MRAMAAALGCEQARPSLPLPRNSTRHGFELLDGQRRRAYLWVSWWLLAATTAWVKAETAGSLLGLAAMYSTLINSRNLQRRAQSPNKRIKYRWNTDC